MSRPSISQLQPGRPVLSARNLALIALAALLIAGTALRVGAIGSDKKVSADERGYATNANRILAHQPYASFKWAPGTPFLFALATRLSGHRSLKITAHAHGPAQDAQVAIELITLLLIAAVAWSIAGPWAAVVGVALAATYLPLILLSRTYLSEPLGGLMFMLALVAATFARRRGPLAIAGAGLIGGLTCLARNDLALGMVVIGVALALSGAWPWRVRALRLAVYGACGIVAIAPWVTYASIKEGRFTPVTSSGPDALFIGTYLPGHGAQFPTVEAFRGEICKHLPRECDRHRAGNATPVFEVIQQRYPHLSQPASATRAALENIKKYAFGQPAAFAGMMWNKFWGMWSRPWSGGNSGLHPDTSRIQHLIYWALAWLGLLGGALLTRRFEFITAACALFVVSALNTIFVAQPRDNVRFMPLLFAYGAAGLWIVLTTRVLPAWRSTVPEKPARTPSEAQSAAGRL